MISFENAPPFAAPLRFFLTAPLFAALAGLLVFVEGPGIFVSRWMPATLAATHLLTIGFMLVVMLGALLQILPVVAGAQIANPLAVSRIVHPGLAGGVLLLAAGFYFSQPVLLGAAAVALGGAGGAFLWAAGKALLGVGSTSPTIRGLKLAMLGLFGVLGLGVVMALALANGWALALPDLANLHAGWGLGAWAGVLLAAIAYVVVPMFQLTPPYPLRSSWWFPVVIFTLLLLWSGALIGGWPVGVRIAQSLIGLIGIAFAGWTLHLQGKRRRARVDATYRYWQLGAAASIFALLMLSTVAVWPQLGEWPAWAMAFGVLLLVGGFVSFINGMLYKILPFLAWMHLQSLALANGPAPNMNKLLAEGDMQRQMHAHAIALALLLAATVRPEWFARPAGLSFAAASLWLWWNLAGAYKNYCRHLAGGRWLRSAE